LFLAVKNLGRKLLKIEQLQAKAENFEDLLSGLCMGLFHSFLRGLTHL